MTRCMIVAGLVIVTAAGALPMGCSKREEPAKPAAAGDRSATYLERLESLVQTLGQVRDVATAKAAAPRLRALSLAMEQIRTDMGKLSDEDRRRVSSQHGERLLELTRKLGEQTRRIAADPAISRELQDALKSLPPLETAAQPSNGRLP